MVSERICGAAKERPSVVVKLVVLTRTSLWHFNQAFDGPQELFFISYNRGQLTSLGAMVLFNHTL